MVTGTHGEKPGDPEIEAGASGLTDREELDENFYKQDCKRVGIQTGTNVNERARRMEPPPRDSFYEDQDIKRMDIRLANMTYYHNNQDIFIDHIKEETIEKLISNNNLIKRLLFM